MCEVNGCGTGVTLYWINILEDRIFILEAGDKLERVPFGDWLYGFSGGSLGRNERFVSDICLD